MTGSDKFTKPRRRKPTPRAPKPIKQPPMRSIKACVCGHPRRPGMFHSAIGCYPEEE